MSLMNFPRQFTITIYCLVVLEIGRPSVCRDTVALFHDKWKRFCAYRLIRPPTCFEIDWKKKQKITGIVTPKANIFNVLLALSISYGVDTTGDDTTGWRTLVFQIIRTTWDAKEIRFVQTYHKRCVKKVRQSNSVTERCNCAMQGTKVQRLPSARSCYPLLTDT